MDQGLVGRWGTMESRSCRLVLAAFAVLLGGCGTNLNEVLLQSGTGDGPYPHRSRLVDSFDRNTAAAGNGGSTTDQGGGGDGSTGLTGDTAAEQTLFTQNNCAACHCTDASGGCAFNAPPIAAVGTDMLDGHLCGHESHPIKVALSDQDLADLQAYLASL